MPPLRTVTSLRCSDCGEVYEIIETREIESLRDFYGFCPISGLPEGWQRVKVGGEEVLLCPKHQVRNEVTC